MSLCIWTSLHLNVPQHGKESRQKYHQLGWMILGLLAPELVVWNAWEQRKKVKQLSNWMQEEGFMAEQTTRQYEADLRDSDEGLDYNGRNHAWTDVHSWFVVMGGLVFEDTAPEKRRFMPECRHRVPLTAADTTWVMHHNRHLIPDISRAAIEDKGKSDQLGKLLTCWQAVFFCIQCIFRLSRQLSITLLEVNVFAHAICAMVLILVWWSKPRDVREPALVTGEEAMDICAYRLAYAENAICSHDNPAPENSLQQRDKLFSDRNRLVFCAIRDPKRLGKSLKVGRGIPTLHAKLPETDEIQPRRLLCTNDEYQEYYEVFEVRDTYWAIMWDNSLSPARIRGQEVDVTLYDNEVEMLVRAYRHIASDTRIATTLRPFDCTHVARITNWDLKYSDTVQLLSLQSPAHLFQPRVCRLVTGLTLAGVLYGGLHLIAWGSPFPSRAETILWRAASITILSTGPWCALSALCGSTIVWIINWKDVSESYEALAGAPFVALNIVFLLWYTLCRLFIIVECFILLAHIPDSALHMPTWTTYIPHIL